MKALLIGLVLLLLLAPCRVLAQSPPALTPDQARAALDVLNDPKKRAEVTATLEAIAKAQPAPPSQPAAAPAPASAQAGKAQPEALLIPLVPDSLGAQVLAGGESFLARASDEASNALHAMHSLPLLWGWIVVMATDPWARGILLDVAWRVAVALLCGLATEFVLRRLIRRPIAALESLPPAGGAGRDAVPEAAPQETPEEPPPPAAQNPVERAEAGDIEPPPRRHREVPAWVLLRRLPLLLARLLLSLVPVLGFVLVGHLVAGSAIGGAQRSRLVMLAVVDAYALCAAVLTLARMVLSPGASRLRLFYMSDASAAYLMRWTRRLVIIAVSGYAIAEVGLLLGLSDVAHDGLLKTVGFVLAACLAVMVLQKRCAVQRILRAPPGATGTMAPLRNSLAAVWHWIALCFIAAIWLVWALHIRDDLPRLLHYCSLTVLLLIGARLLLIVLDGLLDRALDVPEETAARYPGLEARLRLYHPAVSGLLRVLVYTLCLLAILQLYGFGTLTWLANSDLGRRIVSALGALTVTIVLAFTMWELANAAMLRYLAQLAKQQEVARSARLRTLLPLLRSTLLIAIVVVAGMTVLSEIGINIAPLLAGAGIVGVAIGFGAQKLVQDLITGIFLLLENAMQVGDYVTVAGLSGTVAALSVRTIHLRADDGSVHIIPFSSVTTVNNVNRGLGNASVRVTVDYAEDTDRVAAILAEIVAGMRAEPDFANKMLSDLQLWGMDKVDGAEATITGQVVCTDSGRWSVQREFNRRMKKRFQELGIRLYNPMRSIAITLPPPGTAAKGPAHDQSRDVD